MQGIEKTLRDTLSKLGNPDQNTRQKLYKSTENIFNRSLAPFEDSQPDMVRQRRSEFAKVIERIESEYLPHVVNEPSFDIPQVIIDDQQVAEVLTASPDFIPDAREQSSIHVEWPDAATHPDGQASTDGQSLDVNPDRQPASPDASDVAPQVVNEQPFVNTAVPKHDEQANKENRAQVRASKREKRRRRGSLLETIAGSIVSVVFIVFLIGGFWLVSESEYYQIFLDWKNGDKNAEMQAEAQANGEDFIPKQLTANTDQSSDWIEVFGYSDVANVRGRGEAIVEQMGDSEAGGVRITSVNSSQFGEAVVPLNGDKLATAVSRKIALAISMAVEQPTQIYIKCHLKQGVEGDRRRFQLDGGRNDIIIDLDLSDASTLDQQPYVVVNSDITGQGRPVELYDIKYQIIN